MDRQSSVERARGTVQGLCDHPSRISLLNHRTHGVRPADTKFFSPRVWIFHLHTTLFATNALVKTISRKASRNFDCPGRPWRPLLERLHPRNF